MFSEARIRKWHRRSAVILAPLLALQALSGMMIAFEALLGFHHRVSDFLNARETHRLHYAWDYLLLEIHYGGGFIGNLYHVTLVIGTIWLIASGAMIFAGLRQRARKRRDGAHGEAQPKGVAQS